MPWLYDFDVMNVSTAPSAWIFPRAIGDQFDFAVRTYDLIHALPIYPEGSSSII